MTAINTKTDPDIKLGLLKDFTGALNNGPFLDIFLFSASGKGTSPASQPPQFPYCTRLQIGRKKLNFAFYVKINCKINFLLFIFFWVIYTCNELACFCKLEHNAHPVLFLNITFSRQVIASELTIGVIVM